MHTLRGFSVLLLAAVVARGTEPAVTTTVQLSVAATARQELLGFGCSLTEDLLPLPDTVRADMFNRVFRGLDMNVLRLWMASGKNKTVAAMKARFYASYVDNGIIADAQKHGVTTLLLAPARGEDPPPEPMAEYAQKIAAFIQDVRTERGIKIAVTGIANEPSGFKPAQLAEAVRRLRAELDARDLTDVAIIAPEWANNDGWALKAIAGIRAAPAAWAALRGIATHSADMAATPQFPAMIAGTDKQFWITEVDDNGREGPADANLAATTVARFFNDLNHGATHWIYFIGFHQRPDVTRGDDDATKLMVFDRKTRTLIAHLKYDWMRQVRTAFPNGSRVYPLQAQPGGNLVYTYGQKPCLNAAAARRPDGRWSLGVVNLTGVTGARMASAKFHPAAECQVGWTVPALVTRGDVEFEVYRSSADKRFESAGRVVMHRGQLTIGLPPRELATLLSVQ
jgi:hypothetical protein